MIISGMKQTYLQKLKVPQRRMGDVLSRGTDRNVLIEARSNEYSAEERWLVELEEGYRRFQRKREGGGGHRQKTALFSSNDEDLAPDTIVLGCSDCPYTPEAIFGWAFGSLVVTTNLGNRVATDVIDQIRDVLSKRSIDLIVVLGHEKCSAVETMVNFQADPKFSKSLSNYLGNAGEEIKLIQPVESQENFGATWAEKNVIAGVEKLKNLDIGESCKISGIVVDLETLDRSFRTYV